MGDLFRSVNSFPRLGSISTKNQLFGLPNRQGALAVPTHEYRGLALAIGLRNRTFLVKKRNAWGLTTHEIDDRGKRRCKHAYCVLPRSAQRGSTTGNTFKMLQGAGLLLWPRFHQENGTANEKLVNFVNSLLQVALDVKPEKLLGFRFEGRFPTHEIGERHCIAFPSLFYLRLEESILLNRTTEYRWQEERPTVRGCLQPHAEGGTHAGNAYAPPRAMGKRREGASLGGKVV